MAFFLRAYFRGVNKKIANFFIFNVITVFLWVVAIFCYRSSQNNTTILLYCRFLYVAAALIPITFLYFVYFFPEGKRKHSWITLITISFPVIILITLVLFTNLIISDAYKINNQEHFIVWGSLYFLYVIYIPLYFLWSFAILLKRYLENTGIIRLQALYILIGVSTSSFIGMITNLILPSFYNFRFNWLGQVATIIWASCAIYPIARYRLSDIRIIFRKIFTYILSAGFVYGMFYLITWLYNKIFGGIYTNGAYILGLIIAPLFVGLFVWVNSKIRGIANKYLFFDLYTRQETIAKMTDKLTSSINLNKIIDLIVDSIEEAMQLDRAGILLIDQKEKTVKFKIAKVIGFNENNGISLVQDNFLTRYLEKTQKPLVRDELQMISRDLNDANEKQSFSQLAENMKRIEASLCLPMIISGKLIGIIVLGSKISGDAYTSDDLNLLSTLSKQAAIAVDNARLYKEVQDFSKTLQQKVDEQTKEIKQAYEIEKRANKDLLELDEAKTNFMLVTQHHLRTPLTITTGFLDLILSGHFGKISKKLSAAILKANDSVKKEIGVVNDLLSVSSFQLGHGYVQVKPHVIIEDIIKEIIIDLSPVAEERKIFLKLNTKDNIPEITADSKQIKMAFQNIIDNAMKYTKHGGVSVNIAFENDKIKIEVKDTGIGMDDEDEKYLFEKPFQRSKEAWSQNATGKGIGVYLSAQIIKAHGGTIKASSEGRDKGSTFLIELPIDASLFANKHVVSKDLK